MKKIRLKKARRNHEAKQPSQLCNTLDSGVAHPFRGNMHRRMCGNTGSSVRCDYHKRKGARMQEIVQ